MQQLGVILAPHGEIVGGWPSEIAQARGSLNTYLTPNDPFFNERGEVGRFTDTFLGGAQLGDIPTDAELATVYGYTPVNSGWINAKEGYITGPWRFGWDPAGAYGPPTSLSGPGGLGDDGTTTTFTTTSDPATAALTALQRHQDRSFRLMIISTSAIALSAIFTAFYRAQQISREERKLSGRSLHEAPVPTYRTAANVLSRRNGSGLRLVGWTIARTLLIAPPMMIVGVPAKQAFLGAGFASALISTLALLKIFDASKTGLAGKGVTVKSLQRRYAR